MNIRQRYYQKWINSTQHLKSNATLKFFFSVNIPWLSTVLSLLHNTSPFYNFNVFHEEFQWSCCIYMYEQTTPRHLSTSAHFLSHTFLVNKNVLHCSSKPIDNEWWMMVTKQCNGVHIIPPTKHKAGGVEMGQSHNKKCRSSAGQRIPVTSTIAPVI